MKAHDVRHLCFCPACRGLPARDLRPVRESNWTDDAKAELHLLSMNLHNLSVEATRTSPAIAVIVEGYAKRIDELMARAPR